MSKHSSGELEVRVTTVTIELRAPVTDDVRDLVAAMTCAEARAMFGPSGQCRAIVGDEWDSFEAEMRASHAPDGVVANMRREWMRPSPDLPFRAGAIHLWCKPGTAVPEADDHDWSSRRDDGWRRR